MNEDYAELFRKASIALERIISKIDNVLAERDALVVERDALRKAQIPLATLQWWRELVDANPADLAPRLDACIARARAALK